jgi:hypothetical protein
MINFWHKDSNNDLKQIFQQELACTAVAAHNIHKGKNAGKVQERGTGSLWFGDARGSSGFFLPNFFNQTGNSKIEEQKKRGKSDGPRANPNTISVMLDFFALACLPRFLKMQFLP